MRSLHLSLNSLALLPPFPFSSPADDGGPIRVGSPSSDRPADRDHDVDTVVAGVQWSHEMMAAELRALAAARGWCGDHCVGAVVSRIAVTSSHREGRGWRLRVRCRVGRGVPRKALNVSLLRLALRHRGSARAPSRTARQGTSISWPDAESKRRSRNLNAVAMSSWRARLNAPG